VIARAIAWSARHPRAIAVAAILAVVSGEVARRRLSRDLIPDLADPRIVLTADWMGHPAPEVAAAVTGVLTKALQDVPGATAVRGSSMAGMSYVEVVFAGLSRLGPGRQAILDRIAAIRGALPATATVTVGPDASSTGWVFQYAIVDPRHRLPQRGLRRLQDDVLRPALLGIPGVVEVATIGGAVPETVVEVHAAALDAGALAFTDVVAALRQTIAARPSADAAALTATEIAGPPGSAARHLGDVAHVRTIDGMPSGYADLDGSQAAVGGIVIAARNADLTQLVGRVRQELEREQGRMAPGVKLVTVYNRLDLAAGVNRTLLRALGEEIAMVALVILVFLLHLRSTLVPTAVLALVVLATFAAMWGLGVPATIVSLGGIGIALGLAIDAEVVALEACHRRLETVDPATPAAGRRAAIMAASGAFAPAILTSLLITALSFLPVLAFPGETGRLLRPLVLTKTLVVVAAAIATITVGPALRSRLLAGRVRREVDNPLTSWLVRWYRPFVELVLARPILTLVTAAIAVASCLPLLPRLGREFLPRISEGDLLFMPTTLAGVSADDAVVELQHQDHAIAQFKEVASVFGKVGRADTATDPAPLSMVETTIRLRPRDQWPNRFHKRWYSDWAPGFLRRALGWIWPEESPASTAELVELMDAAARRPGWSSTWTAPARARMDMMSTGIRTPVGIRIVAADPARHQTIGAALHALAARLPGTRSAALESLGGEPVLEFEVDGEAVARHGLDAAAVRGTADLIASGGQIGTLERDGRRMRIRVVPDFALRGLADQIRDVTVRGARGDATQPIPLALLGHLRSVIRPSVLRSERGELVSYVSVDLQEGMDPGHWVEQARRALGQAQAAGPLSLSAGERIEWTGQSQLLSTGERRLRWIVPAIGVSMLILLCLLLRSVSESLIVLAAVPFALVGSVWILYLLGYPLSAPVWAGLLLVVGLAMQTAVVMVVYIDAAFHRRLREGRIRSRDDIVAAHAEGTIERLRPKVMTVTTMAANLLPLLWADGAGSEIMRHIAAPMLGGLVTSAFLTLEVVPVLYTIWRTAQLRRAIRRGVPLETIVGPAPSWTAADR